MDKLFVKTGPGASCLGTANGGAVCVRAITFKLNNLRPRY